MNENIDTCDIEEALEHAAPAPTDNTFLKRNNQLVQITENENSNIKSQKSVKGWVEKDQTIKIEDEVQNRRVTRSRTANQKKI